MAPVNSRHQQRLCHMDRKLLEAASRKEAAIDRLECSTDRPLVWLDS